MSTSACISYTSRKRPFQPLKYSDDDDSDIEVIPYKQQRCDSHHANGSSVKENLVAFLQWMKSKIVYHSFLSSALKALGYVEQDSDDLEIIEEMPLQKPEQLQPHFRSRPDSPFPMEESSSKRLGFHTGRRDRFVTIQRFSRQRTSLFPDDKCISLKENRPIPKLLPESFPKSKNSHVSHHKSFSSNANGYDFSSSATYTNHSHVLSDSKSPQEAKPLAKSTPRSSCLKLLDRSHIFNSGTTLSSRSREVPQDVQFLSEVPPSDVLVSRTKLVLPNGTRRYLNGHTRSAPVLSPNSKSSFTTDEVINKREREMYRMLLDNYFADGCWEPTVVTFRSVHTQVRDEDFNVSPMKTDSFANKYLEKYQHSPAYVPKTAVSKSQPHVPRPIFKPAPAEDEVLLDDDDEPFIFKETPKKPLELPTSSETPFFSPKWIAELKQSVEEETNERLRIVEEQEREIEECRRKRREKLNLSGPVLPESVSIEKEELPELTPEMDRVIDNALVLNPPDEVLSQVNQQQVLRKDMDTLNNNNWLNDEVINFYLSLIVERSKEPGFPSVYAFSSFFYPSLKSKGYSAVRRWTRKVDIFSYDINLVPLHLGVHWCLAVIDFRHKTIKYYDSMGGKENCLEVLRDYLINESRDKKKSEYDVTGWSFETMKDIPPQMNGYDCGMFTLKYAEYITRDAPITFTQQNMQYFRRKMVYEIMTQNIF